MKRILVATDGSEASAAAELEAVRLCEETDAELLIVHAWQAPGAWLGEPFYGEALERAQRAAREVLDRPVALADAAGVRATSELLEGHPGTTIVEVAESRGVDLVIVGARHTGPFVKFFIGSVSKTVLQRSTRPVLVVKEGITVDARPFAYRSNALAR